MLFICATTSVSIDFMGACDLVLIHAPHYAPGTALDIHIRTKARYDYSYIETAVVKLGTDTLEVTSFGEYFLNGVSNADLAAADLFGFQVTHEQPSEKVHKFVIHITDEEDILLKTFKDMVSVFLEPDEERLKDSQGMLGRFDDGKLLGRDGVTLIDNPDDLAAEWQVRQDEPMLFQSVHGPQYPEKCLPPKKRHPSLRLGTGENATDRKQAEDACEHLKDENRKKACIYDVMVTGDIEMASQAYL
jgi:hypothetical protein